MCPGCRPGLGRARAGLLGLSILALGLAVGRFVPVPFSGADAGSSPNSIDREPAVTVPAPATEPSSEGRSGAATPATAPQRIATSVPEAVGPLDHPLLSTRPAALWFWQPSCLDCGLQARDAVAWAMQWSTSINFVSVPVGGEPDERRDFARRHGIDFPEIDDDEGELAALFDVAGTPTWGLLFPGGEVRSVHGFEEAHVMSAELRALARSAPLAVLDTWSESAVRAAFEVEFGGAPPPLGWTGSVSGCDPGSTSRAHQEATLSRVNWYRAMAGVVPRVALNDEFSSYAQAAALTMYASGRLDHEPDGGFACMTEWSFEGAGRSNLHLGVHGPGAIDGYMEDEGADNGSVGHRRWILLPELAEIGTGDTKGSNALLVISDRENLRAGTREHDMVMWPPPGYVPRATIYRRWSVSARTGFERGVHVRVRSVTQTVVDEVVWPEDSIGWPAIVFDVPRSVLRDGAIDVEVRERVDGGLGNLIVRYRVVPID